MLCPPWHVRWLQGDPVYTKRLPYRAIREGHQDVFHAYAIAQEGGQAALFEKAVEVIDKGVLALQQPDAVQPLDSVLAAAFATKAFSLEQLGRAQDALATYDQALQRFHHHPELLTARGLLRQQQHIEDAFSDFQDAVNHSARVVWPYLELAPLLL